MSKIIPLHGTLTFEGMSIRTTSHADGRPLWFARDVGRALQYSDDGKGLMNLLRQDWYDEFEEGEEIVQLAGGGGNSTPLGWWLTEAGLNLVCVKTNKPVGKAFRRFISRVLQPLRAFQGAAPALSASAADRKVDAMLAREARLTAQMRERALLRFAESCRKRGCAEAQVAVIQTKAAEAATGEDFSGFLPVQTEQWWTATEIAEELGATVQRIGLIITGLSIRGADGYSRSVDNQAPHGKIVTSYQYNAAGRARIVEAYRAWQRETGGGSA